VASWHRYICGGYYQYVVKEYHIQQGRTPLIEIGSDHCCWKCCLEGGGRMTEELMQLIDLQTKFSFQEDLLQQLNEVVTRQAQQIDNLQRQLQLLQERQQEQGAGDHQLTAAEADETPPHY